MAMDLKYVIQRVSLLQASSPIVLFRQDLQKRSVSPAVRTHPMYKLTASLPWVSSGYSLEARAQACRNVSPLQWPASAAGNNRDHCDHIVVLAAGS